MPVGLDFLQPSLANFPRSALSLSLDSEHFKFQQNEGVCQIPDLLSYLRDLGLSFDAMFFLARF